MGRSTHNPMPSAGVFIFLDDELGVEEVFYVGDFSQREEEMDQCVMMNN